ncbi:MAG TPA: hypothetical protein VI248_11570 [Kineosporiaceae bacterium]
MVVAAMCAVLVVGRAHAEELPNGLTITPVGKLLDRMPDGLCRSGSVTEISGPADLLKGITDSLTVAESHLPSGTITSHQVLDGKLRVTAYQVGPCGVVDSGGAMVWLKPAMADIAYTAVYIALTAAVMAFGYLQFGLPIVDARLEALAGCLAGGLGLAVNNAINGLKDWREILSSTLTGCLTGTALNLTLMKAAYWMINAINWLRGAQAITYAVAVGEVETVGDFAARTLTQLEAQYRIPPPS